MRHLLSAFLTFCIIRLTATEVVGQWDSDDSFRHKFSIEKQPLGYEQVRLLYEPSKIRAALRDVVPSDAVRLTDRTGKRFACIATPKQSAFLAKDDPSVPSTLELRRALRIMYTIMDGRCMQSTFKYWTYKYCENSTLEQFHLAKDGTKDLSYFLARRAVNDSAKILLSRDAERGEFAYLRLQLIDGDECETRKGVNRTAEVKFTCEPDSIIPTLRVDEKRTCEYEATIGLAHFCQLHHFSRRGGDDQEMTCHRYIEDGPEMDEFVISVLQIAKLYRDALVFVTSQQDKLRSIQRRRAFAFWLTFDPNDAYKSPVFLHPAHWNKNRSLLSTENELKKEYDTMATLILSHYQTLIYLSSGKGSIISDLSTLMILSQFALMGDDWLDYFIEDDRDFDRSSLWYFFKDPLWPKDQFPWNVHYVDKHNGYFWITHRRATDRELQRYLDGDLTEEEKALEVVYQRQQYLGNLSSVYVLDEFGVNFWKKYVLGAGTYERDEYNAAMNSLISYAAIFRITAPKGENPIERFDLVPYGHKDWIRNTISNIHVYIMYYADQGRLHNNTAGRKRFYDIWVPMATKLVYELSLLEKVVDKVVTRNVSFIPNDAGERYVRRIWNAARQQHTATLESPALTKKTIGILESAEEFLLSQAPFSPKLWTRQEREEKLIAAGRNSRSRRYDDDFDKIEVYDKEERYDPKIWLKWNLHPYAAYQHRLYAKHSAKHHFDILPPLDVDFDRFYGIGVKRLQQDLLETFEDADALTDPDMLLALV